MITLTTLQLDYSLIKILPMTLVLSTLPTKSSSISLLPGSLDQMGERIGMQQLNGILFKKYAFIRQVHHLMLALGIKVSTLVTTSKSTT